MDPALVMAVEGVRAVAAACAEAISSAAGDDGDRSVLLSAVDVEHACLTALGAAAAGGGGGGRVASGDDDAGSGARALAMKALRGASLGLLGGKGRDADAGGGAGEGAPADAGGGGGGGGRPWSLAQGVTAAHLAPVTDIIVLHEDDPMPPGFVKVSRSITGTYPADLNAVSCRKWARGRDPHPTPTPTPTPNPPP
jgi:hypothetical protein